MTAQGRLARNKALLFGWRWVSQVVNPFWLLSAWPRYARYIADWRAYSRLPGAEPLHLIDTFPQLHDRTESHTFDAHYFYTNGWAMRRIVQRKPASHVDVGSQIMFSNLLAAVLPVTFVEYRPLDVQVAGLTCIGGDILHMPYPDASIESLSCLHVAEHIGLGRYGDPLDPAGTRSAARELTRILAQGGDLYFVVPVGRPSVHFNAHRIHAPQTIREYFADLELVEFSAVDDDGRFIEHAELARFERSRYACGMFWFTKRGLGQ